MASTQGRGAMRAVLDEGPRRPRRRFQLVAEVITELSRVTWPTRQETFRLMWFVVAIAVTVGIFIGIVWDNIFGELAKRFLF